MERLTVVPNNSRNAGLRGFCTEQEAINRLAAYEDAEEQGRLVVLPCKVGDTVYIPYVEERGFSIRDYLDIGKTVFLTREEAEAKWKEV
ncbi:MAG: hypothetical protein IJT76_01235 [Clostridia bacterium]|nr:hypothetical protein [Clostridia bacterium]